MEKIMTNNMKRLTALFVLVTMIIVTVVPACAVGEPSKYSSSKNSGTRDVVCTTLDGTSADSYYKNYDYDDLSKLSESALFSKLQTLMRTTHTKTSTYNDCHYKADQTDCENGDGKVSLIYTSYSATMSQWNGWNREHVWPQSLGGGNTSGGGADLHHIRPSDATVNSTRGNLKYGNVNGGTAAKGSNPASGIIGGYYGGGYFEPLDNVKGDVARICLYVYVRWNSSWGATSITKVFQSVDVLLEWCELDPVDTWEMGRNEVVQAIQGNRNVFIDYPEYAWLIFGREVPDDMTTPSGEAKSGGNGGSTDNPDNESPFCTHTNTEIVGAKDATCGTAGYTGDKYCKDCDTKLVSGTTILATGQHTWGAPVIIVAPTATENGVQKYTCTVCSATKSETVPKLDAPGDDPTDEPVTPPVDDPADDPTDEPVTPPVDDPTDDPTDEPTTPPVDEPVENGPILEESSEDAIILAVTTAFLKELLLQGLLHS